eukprot:ANDGO_01495.mRNA.1 hypothetical protein
MLRFGRATICNISCSTPCAVRIALVESCKSHRRKNMEPSAQVRDAVLRSYIRERTWSINNEFKLLQAFVSRNYCEIPGTVRQATDRMTRFHIAHPFLVEYEWEVAESRTDMGKGDLVFTDGGGRFAVVEVKFIQGETMSGRTACTRRRQSRQRLRDQVSRYVDAFFEFCLTRGIPCTSVQGFGLSEEGFDEYDCGFSGEVQADSSREFRVYRA